MVTTTKIIIALLPFAMLVAGFLVFRLSALMTAMWTCLVEFAVVLAYYHASPIHSIKAGLWGNLTMWSAFLLLWSGQVFGHTYRETGLISVLLKSVESIFPSKDPKGQGLTMIALLSGFIGTFNVYAVYPVAIPGLAELGFDGIQAAIGYLVYVSWCIPFAGLFIGAVIASAATHVPVPQIAQASGLLTIPIVFVSIYGTFRILKFRFFERESQILFWILALSNVAGIILFTQIWPQYYDLTLMAGAAISLVFLLIYGRYEKHSPATLKPAASLSAAATPAEAAEPSFPVATLLRAYAPLLIAIGYAVVTLVPSVAKALAKFAPTFSAAGFSPVNVNLLTAPAFPIFVAVAACYFFAMKRTNPLHDLAAGTRHGMSSLITLLFGSATVYLMVDTGQIKFLGQVLSSGGKTLYMLLDSGLIYLGGMTFGQGAPAVFLFSQMQITPAAMLGLPLALLVGLVTLVAMGPTNAIKPPLIRFAASLVNTVGRDREIFATGMYWGIVQIIVVTITLVALIFWGI
jgi:lactate permease